MNTVSSTCVDNVGSAVTKIENMISSNAGMTSLSQKFHLNPPLSSNSNSDDVSNFFETLAGNFDGVVQYNRDNRDGPLHGVTVDDLCAIMDDSTITDTLDRYAKVNELIMQKQNQTGLDITYQSMIDSMRNISWGSDSAEGGRQWVYQTCTEFGFYQSSDSPRQPFSNRFPIDFFTKQCGQIYDGLNVDTIKRGRKIGDILQILQTLPQVLNGPTPTTAGLTSKPIAQFSSTV